MLLMMGGETLETCWATHKRQIINLWNCCILLVDLFESYDDARTSERVIYSSKLKSAVGLPDHDQQRSNRLSPTVKPEAFSAVVRS